MPAKNDTSIGLASRFRLTVDVPPHDLGTWSKASGLSDGRLAARRRPTGPGKVTLERWADSNSSAAVKAWLTCTAFHAGERTATIELVDATGHAVTTWSLIEVVAVHWSVAAAVSGKMAVETLELAHGA